MGRMKKSIYYILHEYSFLTSTFYRKPNYNCGSEALHKISVTHHVRTAILIEDFDHSLIQRKDEGFVINLNSLTYKKALYWY